MERVSEYTAEIKDCYKMLNSKDNDQISVALQKLTKILPYDGKKKKKKTKINKRIFF